MDATREVFASLGARVEEADIAEVDELRQLAAEPVEVGADVDTASDGWSGVQRTIIE